MFLRTSKVKIWVRLCPVLTQTVSCAHMYFIWRNGLLFDKLLLCLGEVDGATGGGEVDRDDQSVQGEPW